MKGIFKNIIYVIGIVFVLPIVSIFFNSQEKESSIIKVSSADVPVPVEVPYVPYEGGPAAYYGSADGGGDGSCDSGDGGGGGDCF